MIFLGVSSLCIFSIIYYIHSGNKQSNTRRQKALTTAQITKVQSQKSVESVELKQVNDLQFLKNVSADQIKLLFENDIHSITQLKNKVRTHEDTVSYSKKLGVYRTLVEEWIRLGEFSKLYGIKHEYIELLKRNEVYTVMDLQNYDPEDLYTKLRNSTENKDIIPTLGMIKYWIRVSKNIQSDLLKSDITVTR